MVYEILERPVYDVTKRFFVNRLDIGWIGKFFYETLRIDHFNTIFLQGSVLILYLECSNPEKESLSN